MDRLHPVIPLVYGTRGSREPPKRVAHHWYLSQSSETLAERADLDVLFCSLTQAGDCQLLGPYPYLSLGISYVPIHLQQEYGPPKISGSVVITKCAYY